MEDTRCTTRTDLRLNQLFVWPGKGRPLLWYRTGHDTGESRDWPTGEVSPVEGSHPPFSFVNRTEEWTGPTKFVILVAARNPTGPTRPCHRGLTERGQ